MRLPDELLSEMFIFCLDEWPSPSNIDKAPLVFGRVCRRWRNIACNTPRLWSRLWFHNHGRVQIPLIQERVASLWLSRSGAAPFSLYIQQLFSRYEDDKEAAPDTKGRDEAVLKLVRRCKELKLIIINRPFLERILAAVPDASNLRKLEIITTRWPTGETSIAAIPIKNDVVQRLHELCLPRTDNGQTVVVDPLQFACKNLRRVILEQRMHWSELISWLTLCPNLEAARFSIFDKVTPDFGYDGHGSTPTFFESHIRKLSLVVNIRSVVDLTALIPLDLPSLECLSLRLSSDVLEGTFSVHMRQIATLLVQRTINLTQLCILNIGYTRPDEVSGFLHHTPQLKSLTLKGFGPELEEALMALTILKPTYTNMRICCPRLELLDISSCCWSRSALLDVNTMVASRYGIRTILRSKGRRGDKTVVKKCEWVKDAQPIKRVVVRKHIDRCPSCGLGLYDQLTFVQQMKKNKAIQQCIEQGLTVSGFNGPRSLIELTDSA